MSLLQGARLISTIPSLAGRAGGRGGVWQLAVS